VIGRSSRLGRWVWQLAMEVPGIAYSRILLLLPRRRLGVRRILVISQCLDEVDNMTHPSGRIARGRYRARTHKGLYSNASFSPSTSGRHQIHQSR
jgi:hypothetical protein